MEDKQFIKGMHAAVEKWGRNHIAMPAYTRNGAPECIVGMALSFSGECPVNERALAHTLLRNMGCSAKVCVAARVAQVLQDHRVEWGKVLDAFEFVLAGHYLTVSDALRDAEVFLGMRDERKVPATYASGGVIMPTVSNNVASYTWNGSSVCSTVEFTFTEVTGSYSELYELLTGASLSKKDHALTA